MAKPNYQFEKRQRDLAKKRKQEEKRQQKLADKAADAGSTDNAEASSTESIVAESRPDEETAPGA